MKNRYRDCNCSCHTNTSSCDGLGNGVNLLTRIVSVKGIEMKDILFSLHFYTYMSSRKVVVRKDQLIFGGGEYYALINEKDYPEGWLMCDVEILEPANGWPHELKPVTVECSTGYFVGDCSEGFPVPEECRFHKGEGYKNGYNVTFKPSEEIPEIYDPTELFMVDEEDLTLVNIEKNRVAKFKDRDNSKGMGYIILRTGKSLAQQMKEKNTIYEIRYDFDLFGETLEIPEGCVLDFRGGSFSNGSLHLNNTEIVGNRAFKSITFEGSAMNESHLSWLVEHTTEEIQRLVTFSSDNDVALCLDEYEITIDSPLVINRQVGTKNRYFIIKDGCICSNSSCIITSGFTLGEHPLSEYVRFENIVFKKEYDGITYLLDGNRFLRIRIDGCTFDNVCLVNTDKYLQSCYIYNCLLMNLESDFATIRTTYDLRFINSSVESSLESVIFNLYYYVNSFSVHNSLIESVKMAVIYGGGSGVSIIGNYFEYCSEGAIKSINNRNGDIARGTIIIGNRFQTLPKNAVLDENGKYYYIYLYRDKDYYINNNYTNISDSIIPVAFFYNDAYGLYVRSDVTDTKLSNYFGDLNTLQVIDTLEGSEKLNSYGNTGYFAPKESNPSSFLKTGSNFISVGGQTRCILKQIKQRNGDKLQELTVVPGYESYPPISYSRYYNKYRNNHSRWIKTAIMIDSNWGSDWSTQNFSDGYMNGAFKITNEGLEYWNHNTWARAGDGLPVTSNRKGKTTERPTLSTASSHFGFQYFDTDLGKPIWWNGTSWVDANGETV